MSELLILLILTVGDLLSAGAPPDQLAAQVRQAALNDLPFPTAEVLVTAERETDSVDPTATGEACHMGFGFREIYLEPLLVDALEIDVTGVGHDANGKLSIDGVRFNAQISQEALTEALAEHTASLVDPVVTLAPDGITLSGAYRMWLARVPFTVQGNLSVEQQTQLVFAIDQSKMAGVRIPEALNRLIEDEVNPVYDLAAFAERSKADIELIYKRLNYKFYLEVEQLTPEKGHIIVAGKA